DVAVGVDVEPDRPEGDLPLPDRALVAEGARDDVDEGDEGGDDHQGQRDGVDDLEDLVGAGVMDAAPAPASAASVEPARRLARRRRGGVVGAEGLRVDGYHRLFPTVRRAMMLALAIRTSPMIASKRPIAAA